MKSYSVKELNESPDFELIKVVDHGQIKSFIWEQIDEPTPLIRYYGIYQMAMLGVYLGIFGVCVKQAIGGDVVPLFWFIAALGFSFTFLIVIHELLHAAAYRVNGIKKLSFGAIWRKFVFYVAADRQVVGPRVFKRVALAPFVWVNVLSVIPGILCWVHPCAFFFFSIMCIHSLFCAGDMAMLAFCSRTPDKLIFHYDDLAEGKTFFYAQKK